MMRSMFLSALLIISTLAVSAQKKADPKKFAETITEEDLRTHLYIIASAEMEGRETATEGQRKAAAYLENYFKTIGLKPGNNGSFQQSYPVYADSMVSSTMLVNNEEIAVNKDYLPFTQFARTAGQYFSEAVFVGHGIVDAEHDDYAGVDVRGKAVIVLEGTPSSYKSTNKGFRSPGSMYGKIAAATQKGAASVLLITSGFPRQTPMAPAVGNMYVNLYTPAQTPNVFNVSAKVAEKIIGAEFSALAQRGKTEKLQAKTVKADLFLELNKKVIRMESTNVLGYVEGSTKSDEWLIITAHYDHIGKRGNIINYGADDDGSGTVGVMEIAQAFVAAKAAGNGPARNVMFMAVSGEEKGLWGSDYYASHPTIPMDKLTADLNIDMIGRVDTERMLADTLNYIYVVGDDKLSTELKPLSEMVNKKYTKMTLDYKFNDPNDTNQIYFRSDHYNFAKHGIPVIFYYDGMLKADYHKPTDTPDKINYTLLKKRAQLVFYTGWEMANRPTILKRDLPLPTMTRR